MALDHRVLLLIIIIISSIITGSHTSNKVIRVSVNVSSSITIPRAYKQEYKNLVKYLCRGYSWLHCSYVVKTDQSYGSGKYSIFDNKTQRVFNVTIRDVRKSDTDYWCVVEKYGSDDGEYFLLSVTDGTPDLYVAQQEIQGFTGDDISIKCYHGASSGEMGWCRLGGECITGRRGMIDGRNVSMNSSVPQIFTVTMNNVTLQSSGWYLCSKGDLQMPVYVNVIERLTTTTYSTPVSTTESVKTQPSSSFNLMSLLIPLGLLVFVVIMATIIWFMLKKHNSRNSQTSAMAQTEETIYSKVGEMSKQRPSKSSSDVIYSSVVITNAQAVELRKDDIIYSTVSLKK